MSDLSIYQKWETWVDTSLFPTAELFSLMAREVSILQPSAVGALTAATGHALSIALTKNILKADEKKSPLLQVGATVLGLAISTIALPYIISKVAVHTVIRLNFETALRTAMASLALKTTAYGLYFMGSGILERFQLHLPKKVEDINSLKTTELTHLQAYFLAHPEEQKQLTLSVQNALGLSLGKCTSVGEGWTAKNLQSTREVDLKFLTLEQRKELNALCLKLGVLPQNRIYEAEELPSLPEITENLSSETLHWVHLILRGTTLQIDPKLPQQFYNHGLQPARDESFELPCFGDYNSLRPFQLSWLRNFYASDLEEWKCLTIEEQKSLNAKFAKPFPLYPKTSEEIADLSEKDLHHYMTAFAASLFGRVTENITGKQVLAIAMIAMVVVIPAIAAVGSLYMSQPSSDSLAKNETTASRDVYLKGDSQSIIQSLGQTEMPLSTTVTSDLWVDRSPSYTPIKIDRCPDSNCLIVPPESQVQNLEARVPISLSNFELHDKVDRLFSAQPSAKFSASWLAYGATSLLILSNFIGLGKKTPRKRSVVVKEDERRLERYVPQGGLVRVEDAQKELENAEAVAFNLRRGQENVQLLLDLSKNPVLIGRLEAIIRQAVFQPARHQQSRSLVRVPTFDEAQVAFVRGGQGSVLRLDVAHPGIQELLRNFVRLPQFAQPVESSSQALVPLSFPQSSEMTMPRFPLYPRLSFKNCAPPSTEERAIQKLAEVRRMEEKIIEGWEMIPEAVGPLAPKSYASTLGVAFGHYLGENGHPSKMRKYRVVLDEYLRVISEQFKADPMKIYTEIRGLSQKHSHSAMYRSLLEAVEALILPMSGRKTYFDASSQRYVFVHQLRLAIISPEYQGFQKKPTKDLSEEERYCRSVVHMLSETIFKPEIYSHLKEITDLFTGECLKVKGQSLEDEPPIKVDNFERVIARKNEQIKGAPKDEIGKSKAALNYQKLCGALGCEDFIGTKNTPHLRTQYVFTSKKSKDPWIVDYVRHGCPVTAGSLWRIVLGAVSRCASSWSGYDIAVRSGEAIAPEYEEMLYAMKERREGDLYVNHQRRIPGGVENERDRVEAVEDLQNRHDNEFVLTQSVEGSLFKREGKHAEFTTFEQLKGAIIQTFNERDDVGKEFYAQNMLPQVFWKDADFHKHYLERNLPKMLNFIHEVYFEGRENISFDGKDPIDDKQDYQLREWQSFIEAFYAMQRSDLIFRLSDKFGYKITRMKDICKDKLDRGGNEAKNQDELFYYMLGKLQDSQFEETAYQLLGPPILVKKKEAIPKRIKPGYAFTQLQRELSSKGRKRLESVRLGRDQWKIADVHVSKREGQEAFPTLKSSRTPTEVKSYLRYVKEGQSKEWIPCNAFIENNLKVYRKKALYDEKTIVDQLNNDIKGRLHFELDGEVYDGSQGKDAATICTLLQEKGVTKDKALEMMILLQKGVTLNLWEALRENFNHEDFSLEVQQMGLDGRFGDEMRPRISLDTTGIAFDIEVQQGFGYRATDPEKLSFSADPYAFFGTHLAFNIPKGATPTNEGKGRWCSEILSVAD